MVVFIDFWRQAKGFKERRKQDIEDFDWWNVTKKLDLRAFQTLENDERRSSWSKEDAGSRRY